jgi:hypothetical protein
MEWFCFRGNTLIPKILPAFLLCFFLGFFTVSLVWPDRLRARSLIIRCCLAIGFGFGISSCWFFLWLCLAGGHGENFFTLMLPELAVTVSLGVGYFGFRGRSSPSTPLDHVRGVCEKNLLSRIVSLVFYVVLACAVLSFLLISLKNPHGDYDATSTWNLRARLLARGTVHWRDAFVDSQHHSRANLDYPLLLPATVARAWKYAGNEPVSVPIVVAFLFTFSSVGLIYSSLSFLRNKRIGYLGGIVLLGVYSFVDLGAWQYADVVVGWFMLSTIVILGIYDALPKNQTRGLLALMGAAAGFCAWSKNEGQLFLLLVLTVRLLSLILRKDWKLVARQATAIVYGLLPVLAVLAYFKLAVAPANSWVSPDTNPAGHPIQYFLEPGSVAQKLTNVSRYWVIAKAMLTEILNLGGRTLGITPLLLLYFIFAKVKRNSLVTAKTGISVLALMLAGYFSVYLVTPLELTYHLRSSLSRLLLQLWPSAVFVFFMATSPAAPLAFQHCASPVIDES